MRERVSQFVLAELEYFNEPYPPRLPQPDAFHGQIFLRRIDPAVLDATGSVTAAVPPRRLASQPLRRYLWVSSGPWLSGGDGTGSGSPVPQAFTGTDLSHWLACHLSGLQPQLASNSLLDPVLPPPAGLPHLYPQQQTLDPQRWFLFQTIRRLVWLLRDILAALRCG